MDVTCHDSSGAGINSSNLGGGRQLVSLVKVKCKSQENDSFTHFTHCGPPAVVGPLQNRSRNQSSNTEL